MKLQTKNTNSPVWRTITVKNDLPGKLSKLDELSKNLWWAWNSEAKLLFHDLDPDLWRTTGQNPVMLLYRISHDRINQILADDSMLRRVDDVYDKFKEYINTPMRDDLPSVSYFSMEYGLCNALKIYSGGLGILAGDYIKEASDRRVNMTAIGFLYRYGYFTQTLTAEGQQIANYEPQNFNQLPIEPLLDENGHQFVLSVPYPGRTIFANVWQVNVGRMKLFLLDTDLDLNSEYDRPITHKLYGGDWENRIKQEYLLGIGGVMLLKRLGIKHDIYHCNEGHAALLNLQRLVDFVQDEGLKFDEALEIVRATSLYTVHTPVPAGHDYFDEGLFGKYMGEFPEKLGITWDELMNMGRENPNSNEKFSMSVFALNTTQESNGVSWLHGEVSRKMFQGVWKGYAPEESHVGYVTNGVHMPTWAASEWKSYYARTFGSDFFEHQEDEAAWAPILNVPDREIWDMRMRLKNKFIDFVKRDFTESWLNNQGDPTRIMSIVEKINPNALLIGFARRFATYKRAYLLFNDLDRLSRIVNNEKYPVQFIYAGKAHPADGAGQDLIKRIIEISKMPQFLGKIIFLENYDMIVSKRLLTGVDIWLNTPTRPLEASGTSGEKAEMNGLLNFSVLDGWWYEGYRKGAGWALTSRRNYKDQGQQDKLDSATIYSMLENEIIPLYFNKTSDGYSPAWIQYIKNSIAHIAPNYTMSRMMRDYFVRFYKPEAERAARLKDNNYALARDIVRWKENVAARWNDVRLEGDIQMSDTLLNAISDAKEIEAVLRVNTAGLGRDIKVELVAYQEVDGEPKFHKRIPTEVIAEEGDVLTYKLQYKMSSAGMFRFAFRIYPWNDNLPHRQDFAYMKWV
ncbi:MAG: alpha-glucan family phosphorylase [Bacteroidales bacterium]|nr:alpha-glucan family phosphorylase [Candidatus Sodaliphilus aphodohippi]